MKKSNWIINWETEEVHVKTQPDGGWRFFGFFCGLMISHEDSTKQAIAKCEKVHKRVKGEADDFDGV